MTTKLNCENIDYIYSQYSSKMQSMDTGLSGLSGVELFHHLKRVNVNSGPYPDVSLFEAINLIMTDLVLFKGIKWLLTNKTFPFDEYTVQLGSKHNKQYDIVAECCGVELIGESFNVSPSFFQSKKHAMLKKIRNSTFQPKYKLIISNSDAKKSLSYKPRLMESEFFLFIDVATGKGEMISSKL